MNAPIAKGLNQLWQYRAGFTPDGHVIFSNGARRAQREVTAAWQQVRTLLLVRLDAIGDAFMFLDALRKLRELCPNADIAVLAYSETKPVYDRSQHIDRTIYVEREMLATNKRYREACFKNLHSFSCRWDVVLNPLFSREYFAEEVMRATSADVKLGLAGDNSNMFKEVMALTNKSYTALIPVEAQKVRHELHRHNEVLSLLGSTSQTTTFEAPINADERRFAANLLCEHKLQHFGVVFPGTKGGTASIKYWGSENFASLMDQLEPQLGCERPMLLGGTGEERITSEITALTRTKPCILQGDLSLWQSAAILEKAAFFVGSDTSMAHIAAALKVPSFVLLGGGHFGRFFPYPEGSSVTCITNRVPCFNCNWVCSQTYNKCIADIRVAEVLSTMKRVLPPLAQPSIADLPPHFNIGKDSGSRPRIDLVLPPGMQTWHLKESWALTLERSGYLHRVFRPTPQTIEPLFRYLKSGGEADLILALGGDHHLGFLHDSEEKRDRWRQYRGQRVCNSFESTRDSLYKQYVPKVRSALQAFTHFLYSDEVDATIFESAAIPALWWPQAADHRMFSALTEVEQRREQFFFCGKAWAEYPLRKSLLQMLQKSGLCTVVDRATAGEMVGYYNQHRYAINLPGVLGAFNVRTYEALSCGCALWQFLPSHRPANNALFAHEVHLLYYDYSDSTKLQASLRERLKDPAMLLAIARRGRQEMLTHHTIDQRISQMLKWVFDGRAPAYPQYQEVSAAAQEAACGRHYINDRYLFDGRTCWNNDTPNEFADLQFLNYHALLPRLCDQGELLAVDNRSFEAGMLFKRAIEMDSDVAQAHNNLGVLAWQQGDRSRAIDYFEAALLEDPQYRPAVINLGEALSLLGDSTRSQGVYTGYLAKTPADAGVNSLLSDSEVAL